MTSPDLDPSTLVACPQCDTLHRDQDVEDCAVARCGRCGTTLFAPRRGVETTALALAVAALVFMIIALALPFLRMTASGLSSQASVIDAVGAYAKSDMAPLSLAIGIMILVLPTLRLGLLIYVLTPLAMRRRPWPGAVGAFRLNARLQPWSMVEIFMVGVAVAMVKVSDLAELEFGAAFWAFAAVAILLAAKDALLCERTIWRTMQNS